MENEVFYYYLRDERNQPYGCVAIQQSADGKINRGVSICSTRDNFSRKRARALALSRLRMACSSLLGKPFGTYYGKRSTAPVPLEFNQYDCNVEPTVFESQILSTALEAGK